MSSFGSVMIIIGLVMGIVQALNFGSPLTALGLGVCGVAYVFWLDRGDSASKNKLDKSIGACSGQVKLATV